MNKRRKSEKRHENINIKINFDFTTFKNSFPKDWSKDITPSELIEHGYQQIDKTTFVKSYSNILESRITISEKGYKFYDWVMNNDKFKSMLTELKGVRTALDDASREIFMKLRIKGEEKDNQFKANLNDTVKATNAICKMKHDFLEKYNDFIEINCGIKISSAEFRYHYFFFDACQTTYQLHLYFEFIEIFLDIFGSIKKSLPQYRKITPEMVKLGITAYYTYLFTIKKIRHFYQAGASFDKLQKRFPMISASNLEIFTLDAGPKKGWAYNASEVAMDFASYLTETTVDNFRQILKSEKEFSRKIRSQVGQMEDVELALAGEIGVPIKADWSLNMEIVPDRDWIGLLRWNLSHMGPIDEKFLEKK